MVKVDIAALLLAQRVIKKLAMSKEVVVYHPLTNKTYTLELHLMQRNEMGDAGSLLEVLIDESLPTFSDVVKENAREMMSDGITTS